MISKFKAAIIVLTLFYSPSNYLFAQENVSTPIIELFEKTPNPPNTASLGKFLEIPVQMNIGLPKIQIPIYTITSGNIQLPISLSYHAGGVKVDEIAGPVGMNWSLNAGGVVTRRVNGLDDFYGGTQTISCGTYLQPNYLTYTSDFQNIADVIDSFGSSSMPRWEIERFIGRITEGNVDGEADEYFFSTPVGGGKMFYNQRKQEFQFDKLNGWKATYNPTTQFGGDWYLSDNKGLDFHFAKVERMTNPLKLHPQLAPNHVVTDTIHPSSWYLSTINDAEHNKAVNLYYSSIWQYRQMGWDEMREYDANTGGLAGYKQERGDRQGDEMSIDSITFDLGKVAFIYETQPRADDGVKNIKEIRISDKTGAEIKRFLFSYIYDTARLSNGSIDTMPGLSKVLFLASVQELSIVGTDTIRMPAYRFGYDFTNHVARRFWFAQDYWGFSNGKYANTTLIPDDILTSYGTAQAGMGADRSVDINYAKAGLLKTLYHPTGGETDFQFESNFYENDTSGGFRIKKIEHYDSVANSRRITTYSYKQPNGVGSGYVIFAPSYHYNYLIVPAGGGGGSSHLRVENQSRYPMFPYQNSPVFYTHVTKKDSSASGSLVSKHQFSLPEVIAGGDGVPRPKVTITDGGEEVATELYRQDNETTFTLIKKTEAEISTLKNYGDCIWNLQTAWTLWGTGVWTTWQGNDPWVQTPQMNMAIYDNRYKFFRDQKVPVEITSTDYSNGLTQSSKIYNRYDTSNGNATITRTADSKGDTLIKVTKYASQYGKYSSSTPRNEELGLLRPGVPVEIIIYLKRSGASDSLAASATFLEYAGNTVRKVYRFETDEPVDDFVQSYNNSTDLYFDSRYKLEQSIDNVNANNNPTSVSYPKGTEAYIWGHENNYLIAQASNANINEVGYCSFEDSNKGNWTFSGAVSSDITSPTGDKCYQASGGSITKTGLTSGTYIISYWGKNGSVNVNSAGPTRTGKTIGSWTYYEHEVTTTSVTVSGSNYIDELRLYPKGALMKTFTYKPLVGMTSQCDAANRITYYEYDAFDRLSVIRDQDKNVVKKVCYNYAGQQENCAAPCINTTADWRNIGDPVCEKQPNSDVNTGYVLQQQKDVNPCSSTYNQTQTASIYNTTLCPAPPCGPGNCSGDDKKCINGVCETGTWAVVSSVYISKNNWQCTWAYCFSDGSTSTYTQTTTSTTACTITCL